jgi:hypothetical protein
MNGSRYNIEYYDFEDKGSWIKILEVQFKALVNLQHIFNFGLSLKLNKWLVNWRDKLDRKED